MASPAPEASPARETQPQKRQASQSSQRSPSPLTEARTLGPSSPVYILRFARGATSPNEAVVQMSPERLGVEIEKERPGHDVTLYVVRGLPSKFLDEMGSRMGIDRGFVDAHAARGCFRPGRISVRGSWAHWEYPELVTDGADGVAEPEGPEASLAAVDLMREPVVVPLGHGELSVVFRRVSLWRSWRQAVVFLDRAHREDGQQWKKPTTQVSVTKSLPGMAKDPNLWETRQPQQREFPSVEESLYRSFETGDAAMEDAIESALLRSVHDHWLELFGALPEPGSEGYGTGGGRLLWHMLQALEQNVQMGLCSGVEDSRWECLLRRLQRTLDFTARIVPTKQDARKEYTAPKQDTAVPREKAPPGATTEISLDQSLLDWERFNRNSIDRITYLGGILLPLTVVSGILGIEGRYGPEGRQFWVFWVAAFVSSSICLFIIYLDQLRNLDVWLEVAAGDAVEALFQQHPSGREDGVDSLQAAGRRVYSNRKGDVAVEEGG
ncbi:hypothetical protein IMZ48_49585, partial [Candidatus Bathyarchaeota archaeon]|nr:hypothetical protein [Candidatus Bathyarchaeota archaeon]